MSMVGERAIDDYLKRLDRSMRDVPANRRKELVDEIDQHISQTIASSDGEFTEADVRNTLERLGEPEDIANEARERLGIRPARVSWTDPAAIALLLIGGFLFGVGWIVGVVFLWLSDVWSVRDKIIGTLIVPGGLALPLLLLNVATMSVSVCSPGATVNGVVTTPSTCGDGSPGVLGTVVSVVFIVFIVVGPIATAIYLGRKLRRAREAGARP